ncbi:MAG: DNA-protecting protein DprA [Gammaproteobacteria bacterium]|nr:DNA-protecting protein DprA [Gammaproteobacteria bacterium]
MNLTENSQAVLLLTTYFAKPMKGAAKPLTPTEWGRFALWLKEFNRIPASLLNGDSKEILEGWHDAKVSKERINELLMRGHAMALALEKWSRAGIWVLTRSNAAYPNRLKARLKTDAPPVLFGCGNATLLNGGGVAVVGSRNAEPVDLHFTEGLGKKVASEGYSIISGGARGVDEASMLAAVEAEGTVVGVLADSLLRAVTSSKWRRGLMDNNLVLVSPFYPEAGFNVGNAMGRNKYIYCLADTAVVVHSGSKGGTWNGAIENLKKRWVPLWVKPTNDKAAGNAEIVRHGAHWCEEMIDRISIYSLFEDQAFSKIPKDLFSVSEDNSFMAAYKTTTEDSKVEVTEVLPRAIPTDFYRLFLTELRYVADKSPLTTEQICTRLSLHKSQVSEWMKQAVEEKQVKKLIKPVRYQWTDK